MLSLGAAVWGNAGNRVPSKLLLIKKKKSILGWVLWNCKVGEVLAVITIKPRPPPGREQGENLSGLGDIPVIANLSSPHLRKILNN